MIPRSALSTRHRDNLSRLAEWSMTEGARVSTHRVTGPGSYRPHNPARRDEESGPHTACHSATPPPTMMNPTAAPATASFAGSLRVSLAMLPRSGKVTAPAPAPTSPHLSHAGIARLASAYDVRGGATMAARIVSIGAARTTVA